MKIIGKVQSPASDTVSVVLSDWGDRIGKGFVVLVTDDNKQIALVKTTVEKIIPLLISAVEQMALIKKQGRQSRWRGTGHRVPKRGRHRVSS